MKNIKIRVYEFAKQSNKSSKELIEMLKEAGFEIGNHMSVLDEKALNFLNEKLKGPSLKKAEKKEQIETMPSTQTQKKQKKSPFTAGKTKSFSRKKKFSKDKRPASKKISSKKVLQEDSVPVNKEIIIQPMTPADISIIIGESSTNIILTLLKWGIVCPKNQLLVEDVVARLAKHYEIPVIKPVIKDYDQEFVRKESESKATAKDIQKEKFELRPPVVVVMGHVDHGKTTLLDFIRKTRVAAKEKGGITQHLGAYEVKTSHGDLVFLDTPGHEAFTKIRMRGAKVADLVVLVIAADDSVMPQTIEAIKHAKAMEVPIIVAVNKIDKVEQHQIEAVKRDLSQHDLLPEDWGGQTVVVPISAKLGQGVDSLLELIVLQSEMAELKADKTASARGYILESKLEKGRGPVATLICQHGTIKKGDYFVCGNTVGKVNSLLNSYGKQIKSAGPSIPVRVAGFSELPEAGDFLRVVPMREYKKLRSSKPGVAAVASKAVAVKGDINILIKTDTKSSREALLGSIAKLSKKLEKGFNVIHSAVGDVSESDVALAATTGSKIVGFHIKAEPNAALFASRNFVEIKLYGIIYKLLEDLEEYSESKKEIKKVITKIGEAVVLRVFDIKNVGVIAGCAVKDGRCTRNSTLVVWRGKTKVGEGKIKSLQREKKTVKEVHAGFECGFLVEGLNDWEVDDRVECYLEVAPDKKSK